jgi:hypothetical protein
MSNFKNPPVGGHKSTKDAAAKADATKTNPQHEIDKAAKEQPRTEPVTKPLPEGSNK